MKLFFINKSNLKFYKIFEINGNSFKQREITSKRDNVDNITSVDFIIPHNSNTIEYNNEFTVLNDFSTQFGLVLSNVYSGQNKDVIAYNDIIKDKTSHLIFIGEDIFESYLSAINNINISNEISGKDLNIVKQKAIRLYKQAYKLHSGNSITPTELDLFLNDGFETKIKPNEGTLIFNTGTYNGRTAGGFSNGQPIPSYVSVTDTDGFFNYFNLDSNDILTVEIVGERGLLYYITGEFYEKTIGNEVRLINYTNHNDISLGANISSVKLIYGDFAPDGNN